LNISVYEKQVEPGSDGRFVAASEEIRFESPDDALPPDGFCASTAHAPEEPTP
jgi:hypothetical protein